jgi:hypothetical protein
MDWDGMLRFPPVPEVARTFEWRLDGTVVDGTRQLLKCVASLCGQFFLEIELWKRHENCDHLAVEKFRCDAPDTIKLGGQCGCVFKTPDGLKAHFHSHGMEVSDDDVEDRHIYASCQRSFWCGFCKRVLPL